MRFDGFCVFLLLSVACANGEVGAAALLSCPLNEDHRIAYSVAKGVGPASQLWVEDYLWWWKEVNTH
jgi:hypothetical protein